MCGRILIVEDDEQIASILKEYLTNRGYEVNWASTGNEGLDDFKTGNYDLLIVDIMGTTTINSINVKPRWLLLDFILLTPFEYVSIL